MNILYRIADALAEFHGEPGYHEAAAAVLAACPEIAALDHAREGWILDGIFSQTPFTTDTPRRRFAQHVLVIPKPEATP